MLITFGGQVGARVIIELTALFVIIVGLVFGIIALFGISRHGSKGILAPAIVGIIINGLFLFIFVTNFMAARARALERADIGASPATGNGRTNHTMNTFNKDGVQFSYYSDWKIQKDNFQSPDGRFIQITGPLKTPVVFIRFFPASTSVSLGEFAKYMLSNINTKDEPALNTGATKPIVGRINGIDEAGLQFHCVMRMDDGLLRSADVELFMLPNSKHKVIVGVIVEKEVLETSRPAIRLILDSIKLEGEINPANQVRQGMVAGTNVSKVGDSASLNVKMILYDPKGARALIGNKTVMAGDALAGFKIIAVDKDSITVQSPAGVKKELRLGDVLK